MIDDENAYAVLKTRDSRFDGRFFVAVKTTGIYCRPSCPAVMPKQENVRFFPTAAAAQVAGFRACKRCRPDTAPGSPEWNVRADMVGRAMRLIADGVVDREGVAGLAAHLGYSERQVHRQLVAEVGAGPQALARTQRAQTARLLLDRTELPVTDIAHAAGFASIRQFNDTIRQVFATTPTRLRASGSASGEAAAPGAIDLRLAYRPPMDVQALLNFLAVRAVPGVEEFTDGVYRRSLSLPHGAGIVALRPDPTDGYIHCEMRLEDLRDLTAAVQRCRLLLDLDADQQAIVESLGSDRLLGPLVATAPGRRVPGHVDGAELAVRTVLGRQMSLASSRALTARLVRRYGRPLATPLGEVTHLFPDAAILAAARPADLAMSRARGSTLLGLARALAEGSIQLDPGADRDQVEKRLLALPGLDSWAVAYIRMRALGDPDIFIPTDPGVRHALSRLGEATDPATAIAVAKRWRPWRSYAVQHLCAPVVRLQNLIVRDENGLQYFSSKSETPRRCEEFARSRALR